MMFGFGDSHKPNPETVKLVESIVLNQLHLIVQEGLKYSPNKSFNGQELVFLMRKSKYKMRRFIKYLQMKDIKKKMETNNANSIDLSEKPKNELVEFIERIDETGELTNFTEFDDVKHERQLRADRISIALDEEKYLKFAKARTKSFMYKNMMRNKFEKFKSWIDPKKELLFTCNALDVLSYLAYETVAQIIDYAFLVRLDMRSTSNPLSNLNGMYYTASMFNGEHRFTGSIPDYNSIYKGQPPFSPNEIKEVMRRLYSSQTGKLMLGNKVPERHFILAL